MTRVDGCIFGNGVKRVPGIHRCENGFLVCWARSNRNEGLCASINLTTVNSIGTLCKPLSPHATSEIAFFVMYRFNVPYEERRPFEWSTDIDMTDVQDGPDMPYEDAKSITVDSEGPPQDPDEDMDGPGFPPGIPPPFHPGNNISSFIPYNPPPLPQLPNPIVSTIIDNAVNDHDMSSIASSPRAPSVVSIKSSDASMWQPSIISVDSSVPFVPSTSRPRPISVPSSSSLHEPPVKKSKDDVDNEGVGANEGATGARGSSDPSPPDPCLPLKEDDDVAVPDDDSDATVDYGHTCSNMHLVNSILFKSRVFPDSVKLLDFTSYLPDIQHEAYALLSCESDLLSCQVGIEFSELPVFWHKYDAHFVIAGDFKLSTCFYFSLVTFECFSVSSDDTLTIDDMRRYWHLVEAADCSELANFVSHGVFAARTYSSSLHSNIIDMTWVRKWKKSTDKSGKDVWTIKSRLCGRGFLDRQKSEVSKHSSTASRLSHRLLCSIGMQHSYNFELYDISCAFLQGLAFKEMRSYALELGVELPVSRSVFVKPPANVWRHFRTLKAPGLIFSDSQSCLMILECLKAVYGLVDAPLLWQMALVHYLRKVLGGVSSCFDDNCIYWSDSGILVLMVTIHVDDLLVTGTGEMMSWLHKQLEKRFGATKRCTMPFIHLGVKHSITSTGSLFLSQDEYLVKIPKVVIEPDRIACSDDTLLNTSEHHSFRSLLCSMLWVTVTRIDMALEVVLLQSSMVTPTMGDLRAANALLVKSIKNSVSNGLHFVKISPPFRLNAIHDASAASKRSSYAYEGLIILLTHDADNKYPNSKGYLDEAACNAYAGLGQPLVHSARKSKRISNSTSHGETLSAINASALVNLIALRFTELFCLSTFNVQPTNKLLLWIQENNLYILPCDMTTDCMDLFELVCGIKGVPNDKSQRLAIMVLREDRLAGRIRHFAHMPTANMLADGLTKVGVYPRLLHYCITGKWHLSGIADKPIRLKRCAPRKTDITEADLLSMNQP